MYNRPIIVRNPCTLVYPRTMDRLRKICLNPPAFVAPSFRTNAVAVFFSQVIKSLRVACCGDDPIAGFEYSLRNVSA